MGKETLIGINVDNYIILKSAMDGYVLQIDSITDSCLKK